MTIGPEPRMRMRWMSSRLGTGKPPEELVEQVVGVVRSGPGFRVVLDRPGRHVEQREALDRAVVEVHAAELGGPEVGLEADRLVDADRVRAAGADDREAVVLARDLDAAGLDVLDRVVHAAVAERELERLEADRAGEELVAEADAPQDRKSTRLNSSHANISYAVFCLKKNKTHITPISHLPN